MSRSPAHLAPVLLAEALARLNTVPVAPPTTEDVALRDARGRTLAADVRTPWPLPRFNQAAMDGWAVRHDALARDRPTRLLVTGRVMAGEDASAMRAGDGAVRIFTGAMVPPDAEVVVPQERVRPDGAGVILPPLAEVGASRHVRLAGEQARAGAVLLKAGRRLTPTDLALAAGGGHASLLVRARLRVGLLSTGNELRRPGSLLGPAEIPDQNGIMLTALLDELGVVVTDLGRLADDRAAVASCLQAATTDHDLLITSGGASVGEADHLRDLLSARDGLLFGRIAMKPGRPTLLGLLDRAGGGTPHADGAHGHVPVLALPGTPSAALAAFAVIGRPLIRRLRGEAPARIERAVPMFSYEHQSDVAIAVPVSLFEARGRLNASRVENDGGMLAALVTGGALAVIDARRPGDPKDHSLPIVRLTQ